MIINLTRASCGEAFFRIHVLFVTDSGKKNGEFRRDQQILRVTRRLLVLKFQNRFWNSEITATINNICG